MINSNNGTKTLVYVASDTELSNQQYYRRLWLATRNIDISRRDWPDELADAFRDTNAEYRFPSGMPYFLPDIDEVFTDPGMRWMSDFLVSDPSGHSPSVYRRSKDKLRLIDLYFRVRHPKIACHFKK